MKVRKKFLPYNQASLNSKEINEVSDSISSGWLTMGPKVKRFEESFAKYIGIKHALAVNSCTSALQLALLAHKIGPGDEVLVPSLTFVSSVNVVLHVGARPVFVDIKESNLNIDPEDIKKKITHKTKAILAVHYGGSSADLDEINKIAKQSKLVVIEDAAHAVGSKYRGKKIGNHGNTACFSFYVTKNLTTGEGGMLTTNSDAVADYVSHSRLHGISKDAWKRYSKEGNWRYDVVDPGFKFNMTDMQAALGIHQLQKLNGFIKKRQEYAQIYDRALSPHPKIKVIKLIRHQDHTYHLYPILLTGFSPDQFIKRMSELNIGTSVHFIPVHQFTYFRKNYPVANDDLQVTNTIFEQIVSLPLYPSMTKDDINYVVNATKIILNSPQGRFYDQKD